MALWETIIAFGAPAFFAASFFNLNSVGDTYYDWNSEAVFALEARLCASSALALIVATTSADFRLRQAAAAQRRGGRRATSQAGRDKPQQSG